jgi:hypothetical protein
MLDFDIVVVKVIVRSLSPKEIMIVKEIIELPGRNLMKSTAFPKKIVSFE